jgi:type IV pilus assembly protein PilB
MLIAAGLIIPADLEAALHEQEQEGGKVCSILIRKGLLKPSQLTGLLREQFGVAALDLSQYQVRPEVLKTIPSYFATLYQVFPINIQNRTLTVAMVDPTDGTIMRSLEEITGYTIEPVISPQAVIRDAITEHYRCGGADRIVVEGEDAILVVRDDLKEIKRLMSQPPPRDLGPLEWLERTILEAIRSSCREIHIEGGTRAPSVRFRNGGKTLSVTPIPMEIIGPFNRHLETLAKIPVRGVGGDVPREGRFRIRIKNRKLVVLVSSFPIIAGRRLVLELLDEERMLIPLEALGFEEGKLRQLEAALRSRSGLLIVASPAGGGKGTTLYSLLGAGLRDGRVALTIEPSIKYPLKGVDQAALDPASGFTMTEALRAATRQKADIFGLRGSMTSEDLSLVYSLATRHLVLLGVEAGDVIEALEPFRFDEAADVVIGIIVQRLVPLLCPNCKRIHPHPENLPSDLTGRLWAGIHLHAKGKGCGNCRRSGHQGRVAVFDTLFPSDVFKDLLRSGSLPATLRRQAVLEGADSLREKIFSLAVTGEVDADDAVRLAPDSEHPRE